MRDMRATRWQVLRLVWGVGVCRGNGWGGGEVPELFRAAVRIEDGRR